MDCSTPRFPVLHQLSELAQTHVHCVGDAIQSSHPLSSPSPPAFNLSQHQDLFQWVSPLHQVVKVLECNAEDPSLIPGLEGSLGEGKGYPFLYSWASLVAQLVKNLPTMWETWVQSLGWEDPLEKGMATHSSVLAWNSLGRGAWWAAVHSVTKSRTWLRHSAREHGMGDTHRLLGTILSPGSTLLLCSLTAPTAASHLLLSSL